MTVDFNPASITVGIGADSASVSSGALVVRDVVERDPYTGDYTVTPGDEAIVLNTRHLRMTDNVTINPVPPSYGRIGWNGSYLSVY